jgi:DUF4097 and DUF4098 domain-containing protein YvlB
MKRMALYAIAIFVVILASSQMLSADEGKLIEREFEMGPGGKLELDVETGGDISVKGWDKRLVRVVVRLEGRDSDRFEIDFDQSSKGLEIETDYSERGSKSCDVTMEIMVPREFDVVIGSLGGSVAIENVMGEFKGKTMGGDIELSMLEGEVRLMTYGGEITVKKSRLDGRVKTMGGDITITDVEGDIKGSSMGGEVTYDNVSSGKKGKGKDVSITTMGGDIDVDYSGKNIKAKTFGGDVDVNRGEEVHVMTFGGDVDVKEAPKGAKVKTLGGDIKVHSAGIFTKASTMGGDIQIDAIDGWVEASTMGGDVTVVMIGDPDRGERRVELKSMGGDIELTVPKGLSMKFDIELAITKGAKRDYTITSDFDMNIEKSDKWVRKWGQKKKYIYGTGEVGGGAHLIKLKTTNGNITIREG